MAVSPSVNGPGTGDQTFSVSLGFQAIQTNENGVRVVLRGKILDLLEGEIFNQTSLSFASDGSLRKSVIRFFFSRKALFLDLNKFCFPSFPGWESCIQLRDQMGLTRSRTLLVESVAAEKDDDPHTHSKENRRGDKFPQIYKNERPPEERPLVPLENQRISVY